jgi:hypothetical protein
LTRVVLIALVLACGCNQQSIKPKEDAQGGLDLALPADSRLIPDLPDASRPDAPSPDASEKDLAPWLLTASGSSYIIFESVDIDQKRNIYVTGWMKDIVKLRHLTLGTLGEHSAYVLKLDPFGKIVWMRRVSCPHSWYQSRCDPYGIVVDGSGNSYITGKYSGRMQFGSGIILSSPEKSASIGDVFVAKYSPKGDVLWAIKAGAIDGTDGGESIALDAAGNVYVAGYYDDDALFGSTKLKTGKTYYPNLVAWSAFLSKLDSKGKFIWTANAKGRCDSSNIYCGSRADRVAVKGNGEAVISGGFDGEATFGSTTLKSTNSTDFIARLSSTGKFLWVKKLQERWGPEVAFEPTGTILAVRVGTLERLSDSGKTIWLKKICDGKIFLGIGGPVVGNAGNIKLVGHVGSSSIDCGTAFVPFSTWSSIVLNVRSDGTISSFESATNAASNDIAVDGEYSVVVGISDSKARFGKTAATVLKGESGFVWKFKL